MGDCIGLATRLGGRVDGLVFEAVFGAVFRGLAAVLGCRLVNREPGKDNPAK